MNRCHLTRSAPWSVTPFERERIGSYIAVMSLAEAARIMSLRGHRMDTAEAKRLENRAMRKMFRDAELQAMARDDGCAVRRQGNIR